MVEFRYSLGLPTGWHEVPAGELADDSATDAPLAWARRLVSAEGRPGRRYFVCLGDGEPTGATVRAWAFLELLPRGGVTIDEFAAAASAPRVVSDEATVFRRQAERVELAGLPCVVVHDVVEPGGASGGRALHQRLVVTYFPGDPAVVVRFEVSSPDLLVFDDFVRSGVEFANTLRLHEEAPA